MLINQTGETVTVDESDLLQNSVVTPNPPNPAGDADDNDIFNTDAPDGSLPLEFENFLKGLFGAATDADMNGMLDWKQWINVALSGYLGPNDTAGAGDMVAGNGEDILSVDAAAIGTIVDLRFSADASGNPIPADGSAGVLDSGLDTVDGNSVFLYLVDDNLVVGRKGIGEVADPSGDIVFAIYLDETLDGDDNIIGARFWTALYEPLAHPDNSDPDDFVDLTNKLFVTAVQQETFDLAGVPSGQNLFLTFKSTTSLTAIVATGRDPANTSDGETLQNFDTANTSQGGGPTTFGINNQMLTAATGAGDGIVFTFVSNPNPDFTVAPSDPRLDQNEADLEQNIQFAVVMARGAIDGIVADPASILSAGTYQITVGAQNFSFTADGASDTLGDLIDAINASGFAFAAIDGTDLVIETYGGTATLSGFTLISSALTDSVHSLHESDGISAAGASFDVVQLQGGKTAVVKITAFDVDNIFSGDQFVDGVKEITFIAASNGGETAGLMLTAGAYSITSGGTTITFNANGTSDDLGDLITFINNNTDDTGVEALLSGDKLVIKSLSGDTVTLNGFNTGQLGIADGAYETTAHSDIVDVISVTVSGARGKQNDPTPFEFTATANLANPFPQTFNDAASGITITFNADGTVNVSGVLAGDNIEYVTDGLHNRVLIENDGSGLNGDQASANFDIGGFTLTSSGSETTEVGSQVFFEDDGLEAQSPSIGPVEEEHLDTAQNAGNEDTDSQGDLDGDTDDPDPTDFDVTTNMIFTPLGDFLDTPFADTDAIFSVKTDTGPLLSVAGTPGFADGDDPDIDAVITVDGNDIDITGLTIGQIIAAIDALPGVSAFLDDAGSVVIQSADGTSFDVAGLSGLGIADDTYQGLTSKGATLIYDVTAEVDPLVGSIDAIALASPATDTVLTTGTYVLQIDDDASGAFDSGVTITGDDFTGNEATSLAVAGSFFLNDVEIVVSMGDSVTDVIDTINATAEFSAELDGDDVLQISGVGTVVVSGDIPVLTALAITAQSYSNETIIFEADGATDTLGDLIDTINDSPIATASLAVVLTGAALDGAGADSDLGLSGTLTIDGGNITVDGLSANELVAAIDALASTVDAELNADGNLVLSKSTSITIAGDASVLTGLGLTAGTHSDLSLVLESLSGERFSLSGFEEISGALTDGTHAVRTHTLTASVISVDSDPDDTRGALTADDVLAAATYMLAVDLNGDSAFGAGESVSLIANGTTDTLGDLIDAINASGLASARLVGGDLILESISGGPINLTSFDQISDALTDGDHATTRPVYTWDVKENGDAKLNVIDQLDHAPPSPGTAVENVIQIDHTDILMVTDADFDPVPLGPGFAEYRLIDDVPIASGATLSKTVDEDGLDSTDASDSELANSTSDASDGNADAGRPGEVDGGGLDEVTGDLSGLVSVGADEPGTFSLDSDTSSLEAQNRTSKGAALVYDVSGDTLTGAVISVEIGTGLTLTDEPTNDTYTINGEDYVIDDSSGQTTLGDLIDLINAGTKATAALVDGVLVLESINGDDLTLANFDNIDAAIVDDIYDTTRTVFTLTLAASGLFTYDLDDQFDHPAPGTIELVGNDLDESGADTDLDLNGNSGGDLVINSTTITFDGSESANDVVHDINAETGTTGVTAALDDDGKLVLTGTGSITIGGDAGVLSDLGLVAGTHEAYENSLVINFSQMVQFTDFDGDTITLPETTEVDSEEVPTFGITVVDDIPVSSGTVESNEVDEDALGRDTDGVGTDDLDDPDDLSVGNEDDSRPGETTVGPPSTDAVSGDLSGLVSVGADEPPTFSLLSDTSSLEAQNLTSRGAALVYDVSGDTLTASVITVTGGVSGLNPTADAGITTAISVDGTEIFADATGETVGAIVAAIDALAGVTAFLDADGSLVIESEDGTDFATAGLAPLGVADDTYSVAGGDTRTVFTLTVAASGLYAFDLEDQMDQAVPVVVLTGADLDDAGADSDLDLNGGGGGTLVINGVAIALTGDNTANEVVAAINAQTGATGVTAALDGDGKLELTGTAGGFIALGGDAGVLTDLGLVAGTHAAALENKLVVNFSGMVQATDFDGDTITLPSTTTVDSEEVATFGITVWDDLPTITVDDLAGTGTADPQIGFWTDSVGADDPEVVQLVLDSYSFNGSGDILTATPLTKVGDYTFTGSITNDFDGDNTEETIDFTVTFRPEDGTYVFELDAPVGSTITFSSADGSLDAGGPDPVRTLSFTDPETSIVFFGVQPGTSDGDIFDAIGPGEPDPTEEEIETHDPAFSFLGTANMNVSTSGIGIANNNLDTGEAFVINPKLLVDKLKVFIDNSVQSYDPSSEELTYTIFYSDGSTSGPTKVEFADLTPVTSGVAAGGFSFEIDADTGKKIDAVRLTMVSGKIKIPVIEFVVSDETVFPDLDLNFTATKTDADQDVSSDSFTVNLQSDPTPAADDAFHLMGAAGANSYNVDLALAEDDWLIDDFELGSDTLVLLNPTGTIDTSGIVAGDADDVITVDGKTITVQNGTDELQYTGNPEVDDVVVAVFDTIIDGNIVVGAGAGSAGNDAFIADAGANNFAGGDGADSFMMFNPADGSMTIDFDASEGDQIVVSASGFGGELEPGLLDAAQFLSGADVTAGTTADHRFIYDTTANNLYFDPDGAGGDPSVLIAQDDGGVELTDDDIVIIT